MAQASDYLENKILDHVLGVASLTSPSTVYLALYTSDPTDADSGTEASGSGYARQAITFGSNAASGSISNTATITFTPSGGNWGTVTHFGIRDALSGGNLLFHGSLTASKVTADGDPVEFEAGDLTVTAA